MRLPGFRFARSGLLRTRSIDAAADRRLAGEPVALAFLGRGVAARARRPAGAVRRVPGRDVEASGVPRADRLAALAAGVPARLERARPRVVGGRADARIADRDPH